MKLVIIGAALLLAVSGCAKEPEGEGVASAGGISAQQSADPANPAANPQERVLQFVACMREQGVDVPDPDPGDATGKSALRLDAAGADKATVGAAMEKCHRYLPEGGERAERTPAEIEDLRRFAQCMRDNGQPQWPDPLPDGSFDGDALGPINKDDAVIRAAIEKCR